jgi:hypothetical protein
MAASGYPACAPIHLDLDLGSPSISTSLSIAGYRTALKGISCNRVGGGLAKPLVYFSESLIFSHLRVASSMRRHYLLG